MDIKSSGPNKEPVKWADFIYPKTTLVGVVAALGLFSFGWISWGIATFLSILLIIILSIVLILNEYGVDWGRLTVSMVLIYFFCIPGTVIPMVHAYNNEAIIDEPLEVEPHKLMYNDKTHTFVLVIEGRDQPLILDFDGNGSNTYNKIKASWLDNKLKVTKRRIKDWIDDEPEIVYEIGEREFS